MIKKISLFFTCIFIFSSSNAQKLESIFIAPDVFITSKIKPSQDFEGDRGNILFDYHSLDKKRQYSL